MTAGGLAHVTAVEQFAADVRQSLAEQPRQLPAQYLYDDLGSALFEAICRLPWYPLTRVEARLLAREAGRIVPIACQTLVELGPGNGAKMAALLSGAGLDELPLTVHLIDVSATALQQASRTLEEFVAVDVSLHHQTYQDGLAQFALSRDDGRALAMFLGSNIGNFAPADAEDLVQRLRRALHTGDSFLLGADLTKPEGRLLLAYDDPLGVTAAFNRNVLVRLNSELGGCIDVGAFAHRAVWNPDHVRVEMHLVSLRSQRIVIPSAGLDFVMAEGETIWTESSYKYEPGQLVSMLERCGFSVSAQWIDEADRFALTLAVAV